MPYELLAHFMFNTILVRGTVIRPMLHIHQLKVEKAKKICLEFTKLISGGGRIETRHSEPRLFL